MLHLWAILVTVIVNDIVVVTDIDIQNSSSRPESPTHAACLPNDIDTVSDIAKLICASFVARAGLNILNVVMLIPFDKLELALYSNWMSMLLMYVRTWHCRWMHCAATFGSRLDVVVVVGGGIVKARRACEDGKNAAKRVLCFNVITSPDKQTTNVGTCVSQILNDKSLSMPTSMRQAQLLNGLLLKHGTVASIMAMHVIELSSNSTLSITHTTSWQEGCSDSEGSTLSCLECWCCWDWSTDKNIHTAQVWNSNIHEIIDNNSYLDGMSLTLSMTIWKFESNTHQVSISLSMSLSTWY